MGINTGPATGQQSDADKVTAAGIIRADTSVYFKAFAMDPQNFAAAATKEFDGLKNTYSNPKGNGGKGWNDFEYLVAAVRTAGMSKGTGPLNQFDPQDLAAVKNVYQGGYLAGTDWLSWINNKLQSPYGTGAGGPTFSKDITTALQLLDASDAASKVGEAYFKAYGKMPSQALTKSFMMTFNEEAKKQLATTTTTTNASGSGSGTSSSSKKNTVTSSEGFTATEQNQFLASFLKNNYKITGEEASGQAVTVINGLKRGYEDNLLSVPPIEELAAFAADIVGTANADIAKQKLDAYVQGIRTTAGKMYPGAADVVANGQDIKTYLSPVVQKLNGYLDTNLNYSDPRLKQIINYNDGKVTRSMNSNELENWALKQPEAQTSAYGRSKALELAQAFKDGLK